jgi:hypothetical protein
LAGGDATKLESVSELNVHSSLYYLAYEQDKLQTEKNLIKQKTR